MSMSIKTDRRALTRRGLAVAIGAVALAATIGAGSAFAQNRGQNRDRDRTPVCNLMQDDCLMQQLQPRDRERLRQCDPARQNCATLRHEFRVQVEEQWRRRGAGNR